MSSPARCTVDDCDRPHHGRGLCHRHYLRAARHDGDATAGRADAYPNADLVDEFYFLAEQFGARRVDSRIGYGTATRHNIAARLGVTSAALDTALYRHARRQPDDTTVRSAA